MDGQCYNLCAICNKPKICTLVLICAEVDIIRSVDPVRLLGIDYKVLTGIHSVLICKV